MAPDTSYLLIERRPAQARPANTPEPATPLTEEHFALLRRAVACREPVRRATRTARFSAITTLVIGVAGIPLAIISPSWSAILAIAGVCTIGVLEYIGAQRMRRGLPSAARFLGTNQLAFLGLITLYCVSQMLSFSTAATQSTLLSADMQAQLSQLQDVDLNREIKAWAPLVSYGFYSLVILLSVGFQGGLAMYYFTRKRHLEAFTAATPAWVQRLFSELGV
jgi:hypothetical protein